MTGFWFGIGAILAAGIVDGLGHLQATTTNELPLKMESNNNGTAIKVEESSLINSERLKEGCRG